MVAISKHWQNSPHHNLQMNLCYWCPEVFKHFGMPCFTLRNTGQLHCYLRTPVLLSVSTRLILKMSCVDFVINQCAINCLTLVNSALIIWMLRFAKRMRQVWLIMRGYLGRTMLICNTFCIATWIVPVYYMYILSKKIYERNPKLFSLFALDVHVTAGFAQFECCCSIYWLTKDKFTHSRLRCILKLEYYSYWK